MRGRAPPSRLLGRSSYQIHNHHIFPQSLLYTSGYDSDNHLHSKIVNEIANMAFLTASTNLWFSNTPPEEYLTQVEESYPGALTKQFVPMDPALWKVERYPEFLEARRELMARKLNEFMAGLIAEPQETRERPTSDIIALDESATLEFKSTLQCGYSSWRYPRNSSSLRGIHGEFLRRPEATRFGVLEGE